MGTCDRTFRRSQLILVGAIVLILSACVGEVNGVPGPRPASGGHAAVGRGLIARYGFGACHSIPGVAGADAMAAPPLDHFYERSYIAGRLPNTTVWSMRCHATTAALCGSGRRPVERTPGRRWWGIRSSGRLGLAISPR